MTLKKHYLFFSLALILSSQVFAENYPDMVGTWKGHVRVVSSGEACQDAAGIF
ncbi:MAG: hypothetical protein QGE95_03460 [Arenicellales bacterium]|jgi:hypothetical protein|nr:hypothetical protein [Arenicellales bacterium]|tara:strand:- start:14160 stop:14318 length:159 start_codon:yes stop_codon:yes gene_type:complete